VSLVIPRSARVLQEGDSLGDDAFYRVLGPLRLAAFGAFATPVPAYSGRCAPSWWNYASSGATSAIVAARIATEVARHSPTIYIQQLGVNDAQTSVARATTLANMTTILAALPASCQLLIFDPLCWGEKWPTGQNGAVDSAIDLISADLQALLASTYAGRYTFVSFRHGIYDVVEPLLNTPGPGTLIGPLTRPDTVGGHPNALGVGFITQLATPQVSFQP
jgi:lysophospholipase L1-like esterase